jgi:hypothetical protein
LHWFWSATNESSNTHWLQSLWSSHFVPTTQSASTVHPVAKRHNLRLSTDFKINIVLNNKNIFNIIKSGVLNSDAWRSFLLFGFMVFAKNLGFLNVFFEFNDEKT